MRLFFFAALLALFLIGYKEWTQEFRPAKCFIQWPHNPEWETAPLENPLVLQQLQRPFTYLSKGKQSFVFLSEDQRYVLKLFRFNPLSIPTERWENTLRKAFGMKEKRIKTFESRVIKNFTACKIAETLLKEETALIYAHLNPKKTNLPILRLIGPNRRTYSIDPAQYRFAIQRKGELFPKTPTEEQIVSFLSLIEKVKNKGVINLDTKLGTNYGLIDNRAIQLDFGNLSYSPEKGEEYALFFQRKFERRLAKHASKE